MVYRFPPAYQARIVSGHWPPNYNLAYTPFYQKHVTLAMVPLTFSCNFDMFEVSNLWRYSYEPVFVCH